MKYIVKPGHRIEVNGKIMTSKSAPFELEDQKARKVSLMIEEVVDKKAQKEAEAKAKAEADAKAKAEADAKAKAEADAKKNGEKTEGKKK